MGVFLIHFEIGNVKLNDSLHIVRLAVVALLFPFIACVPAGRSVVTFTLVYELNKPTCNLFHHF